MSWPGSTARPVRLADVATPVEGGWNDKVASWLGDTRAIILAVQRQPMPIPWRWWMAVQALIPEIRASLPGDIALDVMNDRFGLHPEMPWRTCSSPCSWASRWWWR